MPLAPEKAVVIIRTWFCGIKKAWKLYILKQQ